MNKRSGPIVQRNKNFNIYLPLVGRTYIKITQHRSRADFVIHFCVSASIIHGSETREISINKSTNEMDIHKLQ